MSPHLLRKRALRSYSNPKIRKSWNVSNSRTKLINLSSTTIVSLKLSRFPSDQILDHRINLKMQPY